jgi:tetratricopeptide (TPR) repeat protein
MKRIERKHLKENELANRLEAAREYMEPRKGLLTTALLIAALVVVAIAGYSVWRQRSRGASEQALAEALVALNAPVVPAGVAGAEGVPAAAQLGATGTFSTEEAKLKAALPKLQAAADAHPDTPAGIQARYHLAGALAAIGQHERALAAFDEVAKRAGEESLYGRMALLGKADTQARAGQLDAAIETWKGMTSDDNDIVPKDAVLMQLARAYTQKGNTEEARKAYTEIVDNHPNSPYTPEAREELENLKG